MEDFTWAQLQTLRAVSRLGHGSGPLDATYRILKFDTMLQLTANLSATFGRPIGVYPETKHADHYAAVGLALEGKTLAALEAAGFLGPSAASLTPTRVIMQSFIRTRCACVAACVTNPVMHRSEPCAHVCHRRTRARVSACSS